jgi:CubicO group peptidase (beta-lactamase class C family)
MRRYLFDIRTWLGLIALLAVLAFAVDVAADTSPDTNGGVFDRIDSYVRDQIDDSGIPGAAIAVVEGDRTVHARGFGDDGRGGAITPQTPFWIGSNTKSFTTLAAMQLVEAGAIELDAPVQRYLPDFRTADADASARITVRHLMNQTSGFSRASGLKPVVDEREQSLEETVADMRTVTLNRPVGETYEYSNLNFVVLGLIVERVSGRPWAEYIQSRIFAPLGMENSYTSFADAEAHGLTAVHLYWFGVPVETDGYLSPGLAPTGGLYASAEDMARYLAMYLQGGSYQGNRLLSADGIRQMLAPATNTTTRPLMSEPFTFQYGRGWFVGGFGAADDARWHLGDLPYFTAWMVLLPETNQAAVVLINAGSQFEIAGANRVMSRIPIGVVNILRDEAPPEGIGMRRFFIVFDAAVLGILAIQVWSLVRVARNRVELPRRPLRVVAAIGPLLWELGASLAILLAYPGSLGLTWQQSLRFIPDIAVILLVVSLLWLATGVVRSIRLLQAVAGARRTGHVTRIGATVGVPHAR